VSDEEIIALLVSSLQDELEVYCGRVVPAWEILGGLYIAAGGWDKVDFIALCCDTAHARLRALEGQENDD